MWEKSTNNKNIDKLKTFIDKVKLSWINNPLSIIKADFQIGVYALENKNINIVKTVLTINNQLIKIIFFILYCLYIMDSIRTQIENNKCRDSAKKGLNLVNKLLVNSIYNIDIEF